MKRESVGLTITTIQLVFDISKVAAAICLDVEVFPMSDLRLFF